MNYCKNDRHPRPDLEAADGDEGLGGARDGVGEEVGDHQAHVVEHRHGQEDLRAGARLRSVIIFISSVLEDHCVG